MSADITVREILVELVNSYVRNKTHANYEKATKAIQSLILQARIDERVKLAQQPLEALPSIFLNDEDVQKRLKASNSIDGGA